MSGLSTTEFQIAAPAGWLQVRALWQPSEQVVLICHPHPLFGGTMDNKVVSTLFRFFRNQNISVVTFNFRGVGSSTGQHADGVGEIDDALTVLRWIMQQQTTVRTVYLAGFSFGAYIAAAVASRINQQSDLAEHASNARANELTVFNELPVFKLARTYLVAPPVHHYPMDNLTLEADTVVLMGDEDEVVPPVEVQQWSHRLGLQLVMMPHCSHFFHGHLPDLTQQLAEKFP